MGPDQENFIMSDTQFSFQRSSLMDVMVRPDRFRNFKIFDQAQDAFTAVLQNPESQARKKRLFGQDSDLILPDSTICSFYFDETIENARGRFIVSSEPEICGTGTAGTPFQVHRRTEETLHRALGRRGPLRKVQRVV